MPLNVRAVLGVAATGLAMAGPLAAGAGEQCHWADKFWKYVWKASSYLHSQRIRLAR